MKRPQLKTYKFEIMKSPVPPQLLKVLSIRAQDAEEAYRSAYNRFHGRKWPSGPERLYAQVKTEKGQSHWRVHRALRSRRPLVHFRAF